MMNLKKICIIGLLIFVTQNIFSYLHSKHYYNSRGVNTYDVVVGDMCSADDSQHLDVVAIVDFANNIFYCWSYNNKGSAMQVYQILIQSTDILTLEMIIYRSKWEYWHTYDNSIYYHFVGEK